MDDVFCELKKDSSSGKSPVCYELLNVDTPRFRAFMCTTSNIHVRGFVILSCEYPSVESLTFLWAAPHLADM